MGVYNCQLFNNLGLCCFYAQQYDMTLTSFERALSLAENEEEAADVWYNLGHIAVVCFVCVLCVCLCGACVCMFPVKENVTICSCEEILRHNKSS